MPEPISLKQTDLLDLRRRAENAQHALEEATHQLWTIYQTLGHATGTPPRLSDLCNKAAKSSDNARDGATELTEAIDSFAVKVQTSIRNDT